ncbi:hypothetical protein GALL_493240 [mine drainage metagenome]|uniref:Uncharacterized protein n=1 Tax=mine drainage metagenome TaxID=410659 RepID=A0A1J5PNB1_9ZZZZ
MRHADHHFLHAELAGALHQGVHRHDEALAAFERKPFLAHVLGGKIALQPFGRGQALQQMLLGVGIDGGAGAGGFQPLLPPALLILVADVHELGTDGTAIGFVQVVDQLAQRQVLAVEKGVADVEHRLQISVGKAIERRFQIGDRRSLGALERIEVGPAHTHVTVGGDQLLRRNTLARQIRAGDCLQGADRPGLGPFGKCGNDWRMGHVARIAAVERRHMLQRVEVVAPVIGNGTGIGEIALVHFFDVRSIAAKQVGIGAKFLQQHMRSQSAGYPGAQWENILPRLGHPDWRICGLSQRRAWIDSLQRS